jgi:hypothetical protein
VPRHLRIGLEPQQLVGLDVDRVDAVDGFDEGVQAAPPEISADTTEVAWRAAGPGGRPVLRAAA